MTQNRQPNFAEAEMDDQDEGRVVENSSLNALMQVSEAEVNRQILTARAYPRLTESFRRDLQALVCYDEETALSCLYALKRSGKAIQGPSIRFAEATFQTWGNARCGSRIVDIGDEFITAQGFFWDLEKNTGLAFEVLRRITDKDGNRYGDDMIGVTGNAACSIALRNAILRGIPKTAWNPIYNKCRQVSVGAGKSITEQRDNMLKAFAPLNVDKNQVFGLLGVKGMDDITVDQLILMGGILSSIKEGEARVEDVFALENMVTPGQVLPPQPRRNDFKEKSPPAQQQPSTTKKQEPAAEETALIDQGDTAERDTAAETERKDFIKEAYAELETQTKLIDNKTGGGVSPLRERIIEAGVMNPEEEIAWVSACDAKGKAIMAAAKKAK